MRRIFLSAVAAALTVSSVTAQQSEATRRLLERNYTLSSANRYRRQANRSG